MSICIRVTQLVKCINHSKTLALSLSTRWKMSLDPGEQYIYDTMNHDVRVGALWPSQNHVEKAFSTNSLLTVNETQHELE